MPGRVLPPTYGRIVNTFAILNRTNDQLVFIAYVMVSLPPRAAVRVLI